MTSPEIEGLLLQPPGPGSAMQLIEHHIVPSGGETPVEFLNIPQTFSHLELVGNCRTDEAAAFSKPYLRFNNDSGANYDYQWVVGEAATTQAAEFFAQTLAQLGWCAGNTAPANVFGGFRIFIPGYASTVANKTFIADNSAKWGTAAGNMIAALIAAFWRSNSAISRITLTMGSSVKFVADSKFSLYGFM